MKRAALRSRTAVRPPSSKRRRPVAATRPEKVPDLEDLGVDVPAARAALLDWYSHSHRDLPWRRAPGSTFEQSESFAYRVWVSEVMLQQTQVVKVMDYFDRWMQKWPTVEDLAKATLEEVREMWAGLGYYSRAARLLQGAQYIVEKFDGRFPRTAQELQTIPGVGPYTSRAVASIAFGVAEAVVDGNVVRVLSRMFAVEGDPQKQKKRFQQLADEMLDEDRAGDFNQAMMELGALICRPTNPCCNSCPLKTHCRAYHNQQEDDGAALQVTDYPMIPKKAPKREESVAVCVLRIVSDGEDGDSEEWFLLLKRPKKGLLAGLWEFPTVPLDESEAPDDDSRRSKMDTFLATISNAELSPTPQSDRVPLRAVTHVFTHIRMTLHVETLVVKGEVQRISFAREVEHKLVSRDGLHSMGLCSMVRKVRDVYMQATNKEKTISATEEAQQL